ncbi:hypothetical protein HZA73_10475 [candidate division TA06 bacterium]|nr:hypothetical protein [candidate division TA06 bacterium]
MKTGETQVMLGVRIPAELKGKLAGYCEKSGIKLSYLVTQAIREKLEEIADDAGDLRLAVERKNEGHLVAETSFNAYLKKRRTKSSCSK